MINFQILLQKNEGGQYLADYAKLHNNARTEKERTYIMECARRNSAFNYNFIYIIKQRCGHYELMQTPCNENNPIAEIIRRTLESKGKYLCTRCILSNELKKEKQKT